MSAGDAARGGPWFPPLKGERQVNSRREAQGSAGVFPSWKPTLSTPGKFWDMVEGVMLCGDPLFFFFFNNKNTSPETDIRNGDSTEGLKTWLSLGT